MTALAQIGTGAGTILLAALVVGVFRALLALRDNTRAVNDLTGKVDKLDQKIDTNNSNLVGRVENLERWRIATEARRTSAD